ncbi:Uncharacterised protein [Vibrio cholerae]|nr:Uncharacterised protein [Vibrio cholerae]
MLENATQHHSFSVIHQHLSANTLSIDRYRFTRTGFHRFTASVLGHTQVEHQAVIWGDLWCHLQA